MADWWQWSQKRENEALTFAVVGVGRFGTAVCRELISNGADVLAADYSEKAIDDLRQLEPSIEARVVDCTDEESMKKHNRDATVISMILGFTTLALFVDGLLRMLGIIPPFMQIDIDVLDKIVDRVESDVIDRVRQVPIQKILQSGFR